MDTKQKNDQSAKEITSLINNMLVGANAKGLELSIEPGEKENYYTLKFTTPNQWANFITSVELNQIIEIAKRFKAQVGVDLYAGTFGIYFNEPLINFK